MRGCEDEVDWPSCLHIWIYNVGQVPNERTI